MTESFSLASYGITAAEGHPERRAGAALRARAEERGRDRDLFDRRPRGDVGGEVPAGAPTDKRIVREEGSENDVWWGKVNIALERPVVPDQPRAGRRLPRHPRHALRGRRLRGLGPQAYRIKIRVICSRAYHALFMWNMFIRPSDEQLESFGEPDYTIINAGAFSANRNTTGMTSKTSIALHFGRQEFVILGSEYAGEMKKGVFTIMHYLMPKQGVLSMHCSANEGHDGDVSLFFGLSGTGKTTLSADPRRKLIGDDEHCWSDDGVFNIEGGCYAKAIALSKEQEPEIWNAIQFGSVLENVVYDPETRVVDYNSTKITENTRCSYPIEYIPNAKLPCMAGHPQQVVFLTADAFGVLPPVARLTPEQAMYHFISGYTAKVAGTEMGVKEPSPIFSACFGAPFLVWHPGKYAELLADKLRKFQASCWLVNTGWTGGPYGTGRRMSLPYTRSILDAIHNGTLAESPTVTDPVFGFEVPTKCPGVPDQILNARGTWADKAAYDSQAKKLSGLFRKNFEQFSSGASDAVRGRGPRASGSRWASRARSVRGTRTFGATDPGQRVATSAGPESGTLDVRGEALGVCCRSVARPRMSFCPLTPPRRWLVPRAVSDMRAH
jgi:phosphoenolpyruvate carboxykinase (ATP)